MCEQGFEFFHTPDDLLLLADLQLDRDGPYDSVEELTGDGCIAPVHAAVEHIVRKIGETSLKGGKFGKRTPPAATLTPA